MVTKYIFQRGTCLINGSVPPPPEHKSVPWGSIIKSEVPEDTLSCQRFYPDSNNKFYGYDLVEFARLSIRNQKDSIPVIWEGEIDKELFEQIKPHLYVIIARGSYNILRERSMVELDAQIVSVKYFTFEQFVNLSSFWI